ncbi:hypothetical protein CPARK_000037800 [cyanobacterium endosymbiont of Braarudosphaera bigelowii]|uniref:Uncharacterized protein n=2 Tax=Candidatus Atelocyanobacterium thalassae TaxID=713887 RepID=A0A086CFI3_9CHRO|nr:MAG: hypothetical protein ucyna2_01242 [Candidatus Atelocyanobacterium thalassa isolate SIO64986]BDA39539.1 hypothetical protein CPARK_000037800 [cyanobacterium endosymbiont of Braarudosphaera bigelowii]
MNPIILENKLELYILLKLLLLNILLLRVYIIKTPTILALTEYSNLLWLIEIFILL